MFLVGGGILLHGVPALGHAVENWAQGMAWGGPLLSNLAGGVAGLVAGAVAVGLLQLLNKIRAKA
jgi:predicted DNA repair protein MutK